MRRLACLTCLAMAGCHAERDANRAALASPDPVARARAAQALGQAGDPDDLGYLIGRVGDPDPLVRAAVANGLGHIDDRHSADGLAELAEDGNEAVQLQAVAALGRMKVPRARSYLLLAYQRGDSAVRAKVAETLATAGASPAEAVEAEARALYEEYSSDLSGSGPSRLTAAEQLGHSGRPEAVERLVGYLAAESHALAIAAARGLGASGAPEARAPLEALLIEDDPDLQVAGAQALGALGDPAAGPALLRTLQRGGKAGVAALRSLLDLAATSSASAQLLCGAALVNDPDIARQAGAAVRAHKERCPAEPFVNKLRAGGPEIAGPLAGLAEIWAVSQTSSNAPKSADDTRPPFARIVAETLRSGPAESRAFAARAATSLDLVELLPDLEKARDEARAQVQLARDHWAKGALPELFTPGFGETRPTTGPSHAQVQALLGKLDDLGVDASADDPAKLPSLFSTPPTWALALWAESALAEIRFNAKDSGAQLSALRADVSPTLRLTAVQGIRWLPHEQRWVAIVPLLDDLDPGVREAAVSFAGELDPPVPEAGRWLLDQVKGAGAEPDVPLGALVEALGHYPQMPGVRAELEAQLRSPEAASAAVEGLLVMGGPESKEAMLRALKSPRGVGLDALLPAVGKLGDPAAIPICRSLLFHVQPEVRAAAVRALLALAGPKEESEVKILAQDYDRRVRQAVSSGIPVTH